MNIEKRIDLIIEELLNIKKEIANTKELDFVPIMPKFKVGDTAHLTKQITGKDENLNNFRMPFNTPVKILKIISECGDTKYNCYRYDIEVNHKGKIIILLDWVDEYDLYKK